MGGLSKHMMHPYDDVMMPINNLCDIIEKSMNDCKFIDNPSVDEILETEKEVYEYIDERW